MKGKTLDELVAMDLRTAAIGRYADIAFATIKSAADDATTRERMRIAARLRDCNYPEALIASVEDGSL